MRRERGAPVPVSQASILAAGRGRAQPRTARIGYGSAMSATFDVAVAGLGAMGAAAACHLARRGLRVVGFDRFSPPHDRGSSHGETRIIRVAYFEDPRYVPLVRRAWELWTALEHDAGERLLERTGGLMIGPPDGELVRGALASAKAHGLEHEALSPPASAARFPAHHLVPGDVAVWEPLAGVLRPEPCVEAHLEGARRAGAELHVDEPVLAWEPDGEGVRLRTARGDWLSVHASPMHGGTQHSTVLILEEPGPGELTSLILTSHGVTGAQARVVALVLRGYSTKQIARQLAISQYTIQEHLRAVFDKLGVRSRQELAAALMRPSH